MSFNVINGELYVLGDSFFSGSITGSSNISASGNLLINNIIVNDITGSGDLNISGSIYLQTTPTTGTPTININSFGITDRTINSSTFDISTTSANRNLAINSADHLYLRAGTNNTQGRIYIRSGLSGYASDILLRVPSSIGDRPSTKIIKEEITELNTADIEKFLEATRIVKYKNRLNKEYEYSIIIEDEQEKENSLIKDVVKREEGLYVYHSYEEIPDFLKPYVDTENFTVKTFFEEDIEYKDYYFNPLVFDNTSFNNIAVSAIQYNYNRIKQLEKENQNLKEIIAKILDKIGGV
jgi:hypothetical protein